MLKFLLRSRIIILACVLMTIVPTLSCTSARTFDKYELFCIVQSSETPDNEKWAHYLFTHLEKRTDLPALLTEKPVKDARSLIVKINFDSKLGKTYRIDRTDSEVQLSTGDKDVMLWLCYQFISNVAEQDARFKAADLPPSAVEMENTNGEFPFEFRGIYSPSNANEDMLGVSAAHHVDYNWALWGHNLWKVLGDNPNPDVYAEVNGNKETAQFCFSSEALYKAIETYIVEQWGEGSKDDYGRFTIMPMDNRMVCTCAKCKAAGNVEGNATPAVTNMLLKLAKRFPRHKFFTSAYATTAKRPTVKLPANVGVLISAMDIPMCYDFKSAPEFADFNASVKAWSQLTKEVYIWDYSRNFDDYFTPYPCLSIMQQRLQYYHEMGVKGVFINGSGDDYSVFDDVQTAALQAMLVNPDLDVNSYVERYFNRFYPTTANVLTAYYQTLEQKVIENNINLPYYGGIADELSYIDIPELEKFRVELDKKSKTTKGDERTRLNKMLTALSFTALENMRLNEKNISLDKATDLLEILQGYDGIKDMTNYKEALGTVETYIEQWNDDNQNAPADNKLRDKCITAAQPLTEEASDVAKLTDGRLGFYSDYHTCWLVSKKPWQLTIPATDAQTLRLSLLVAPAWYIWEPQQIEIQQAGQTIAKWTSADTPTDKSVIKRTLINMDISKAAPGAPLTLKMTPVGRERAAIGCDEIMAF